MIVLYVCDGNKADCTKTFCKYNGSGECNHTMSEGNAKYGVAEKITADRFAFCDDMAIEIDREEARDE